MRDQHTQPAYIISASHVEDSQKQNDEATSLLELGLTRHKIPHKPVRGHYLGADEDSFLCVPRNDDDERLLLSFARIYCQESVLYLDEDRNATLFFTVGNDRINLGKFRETSRLNAAESEGWTFDPSTNTYYICGE